MTNSKKNRLYKLHYKLRKRGNKIITRERFITKRATEVSAQEQKWLTELIGYGYGVCDDMFSNPISISWDNYERYCLI